ncbi:hypothetical protein CEXT_546931 [Caerostris extrusa]|uniref:Galectin n=1 Tax=Caerostris extrusa TaxID=172846 RepID=A0AAV4VI08_CAEEX|nr:hypothetical protein CEXT_546931 [Caerostris extrusa]
MGNLCNEKTSVKPLQPRQKKLEPQSKTGSHIGRVGGGPRVWKFVFERGMVETSAIGKNWNLNLRVGRGTSRVEVCINNEEWLKPLQSAKTGTSIFKSGRVDLVCGVCINNEEWLKPL